ncbi:MAG: hypothetical protein JXA18_12180 [Chitinispirillaceae bacterium]|nr:hypothetical protein [Chitinispirillaceae bacterium]
MNEEKANLQGWLKLLNPEELKVSLIQAAMFILFFEILKQKIIDKVQGFYADEITIDEKGRFKYKLAERYTNKVLALCPKSEFRACCIWFEKGGAIDQSDIETLDQIRLQRNSITHEMTSYLTRIDKNITVNLLIAAIAIMKKIDVWWIREIEAGIGMMDDLDPEKVDWESALSLQTIILSYIAPIFTGNDEDLRKFYNDFKEFIRKKTSKQ